MTEATITIRRGVKGQKIIDAVYEYTVQSNVANQKTIAGKTLYQIGRATAFANRDLIIAVGSDGDECDDGDTWIDPEADYTCITVKHHIWETPKYDGSSDASIAIEAVENFASMLEIELG
jgi:hypothetical protein